eukprot:3415746-Amphidinium_carterae.3
MSCGMPLELGTCTVMRGCLSYMLNKKHMRLRSGQRLVLLSATVKEFCAAQHKLEKLWGLIRPHTSKSKAKAAWDVTLAAVAACISQCRGQVRA